MKCNKCNRELPNDSEFCQYCGSKFESNNIQTEPLISTTDVAPKNKVHKTKKKSVKIISLILSFIIVIGATASITLYITDIYTKKAALDAATKIVSETIEPTSARNMMYDNGANAKKVTKYFEKVYEDILKTID